jgi:hypothetical protein
MLCGHMKQTTPRRDDEGEYRRCLDCGGRIPWSWPDDFPISPPRRILTQASKPAVHRLTTVWDSRRKSA